MPASRAMSTTIASSDVKSASDGEPGRRLGALQEAGDRARDRQQHEHDPEQDEAALDDPAARAPGGRTS